MNNLIELFEEFDVHLLNDKKPSEYFDGLLLHEKEYIDTYPLKILLDLKKVEQNPMYHPEGNVYNHTMEVVDRAAEIKELSKDKKVFMWAALLHDVGKITTTKIRKGRIISYDHDKHGEEIARNYLLTFMEDDLFVNEVVKLVRWHMQPLFVCKELPFSQVGKMINETSITEVALLSLCDRTGRGRISKDEKNKQMLFIIKFLTICRKKVNNKQEINRIDEIKSYLINEIDRNKD
ncbi:HD domain-containing protein [Vallitalea guaymasensis]|uniref:HD domain-containing protein n=1 Tax=Vallitalea guaymasensis TaxID=1185412 RepID=A0A8J8SAA7_9FIRM|nr:HD domain-containing protein [Vallitalea guaymasensis]QUH27399.1 HD domain-containing protein [Vallitalea guaymasensis]